MAELIIVFREVLEGALIVGILYTYLNKTEQQGAIIRLWQGVISAIGASVIGSILFQMFADGFKGQAAKLFEGIVMIAAAAILGTVIVWMAKNRKKVKKECINTEIHTLPILFCFFGHYRDHLWEKDTKNNMTFIPVS